MPDPPIPDPPIPWVGLAAMAARFLLLSLPDWLFAGPRTIKRRPRRHICGDCGGPWTDKQTCTLEASNDDPPLWGELRRLAPPADLERRPKAGMFS